MFNRKMERGKYVLLADDDRLFLRVLTEYLDEAGYCYVTSRDGEQALDCLKKYPDKFFVVLADRVMPRLCSLDLLVEMKAASLDHIPLVLLTGEASPEERREAFLQGAYDFLYKPVSKELLWAILRKIKVTNRLTC